jgi:hypothetical protein
MRVADVTSGLAATTGGPAHPRVSLCLAMHGIGCQSTVFTTDLGGSAFALGLTERSTALASTRR